MARKIGLIGAMPQELQAVVSLIQNTATRRIGGRDYHVGQLEGLDVVAVLSRGGKVAAAITVTTLILEFDVDEVIFTGVAGGLDPDVHIGDVVIGERLIQHDVDPRPVMPRFEVPLLGVTYFHSDPARVAMARAAAEAFFRDELPEELRERFDLRPPQVRHGDIASGDQFIATARAKQALTEALPRVLCVEMEGAAVAQACYELGRPCLVIRTISDAADDEASFNFMTFIDQVASRYARSIIAHIFRQIASVTKP